MSFAVAAADDDDVGCAEEEDDADGRAGRIIKLLSTTL